MIRTTRRAFIAGLLRRGRRSSQPRRRSARCNSRRSQPVTAQHGMVVAQESRAALIGAEVLKRGGNAVDAAVAVGFAMAVTYPRAGNIGGGGFMLIHLARRQAATSPSTTARPRRPRPPRDTFLNAQGRGRSGEVARARASPSACRAPSRA